MTATLAINKECSCGVPDCPELGWPHEWDPTDCNDSCVLDCGASITLADSYQRFGSGYAHTACIEGVA